MADDGLITYEEAIGAPPAPAAAAPAPTPSDDVPNDTGAPPLTIHGDLKPPAPTDAPAAPSDGLISYEDAAAGGNPHPSGPLANSPDDGYVSAAAKGLGTAAVKAVGDSAGFVTGLGNLADYIMARAQSKITGAPVESVLAGYQKAKTLEPAWLRATDPTNVLPSPQAVSDPILAKTGEYVPTTEPGRLAQSGAEAALASFGPGGGAARAPISTILRAAPAIAATTGAAGAIGQGVTDATGDPLLGLVGGIVGGGALSAAGHGLKALGAPAIMGVPGIDNVPVIGPRVAALRDNAAAGEILARSSDPQALRDWAAQPPVQPDIPGSPQTLAGAVGNDQGLFQAEKDARNVDNGAFNAIDRAQSDAQQAAIQSAQPTGDVFRPGQVIRQRLDAIDQAAEQARAQLQAAHDDAVTRRNMASQGYTGQAQADLADRTIARGQASGDQKAEADAARQAQHDQMVQAFQQAHETAAQAARDGAAPLNNLPNAETTGATLRTALDEAQGAAKEARQRIYKAVDPDGTLTVVATPLKAAKAGIAAAIDPHAGVQPSGAEAKLWSDIDRLPDVVPFKSLQTLDGRVTAAMADARRNPNAEDPQALGRLTQLKSAVMSAINDAAENQAAHESRLVQAGLMKPEDTMEALVQQWVDDHLARKAELAGNLASSGPGPGGGTVAFAGTPRAAGQGRSQSGDFASDSRLAPGAGSAAAAPLQPNFDPAAAERLTAAKAVHADYAQTYRNPTIKPILETNGFAGQYKLPNGAIPARAVVAGDRGYGVAKAFLKAANNDPRAVAAMQDAVLNPLRKTTMPSIGMIHPQALARWKDTYGPTLRALEEVAPGFSSHFDDAAQATQNLIDLGARHKQQLAGFQREAARQAIVENLTRRQALGQATKADREQVQSLIAERAEADRDANAQSRQQMKAGIATVKGRVSDAYATPGAEFEKLAGGAVSPVEVENAVGKLLATGTSGVTRMRGLVQQIAADPEALAGLRKAGTDWMVREFQNADGHLAGARFIDFVRDNRDVLKELYGTAHTSMLGAVARDAEVNSRWRTMTAIKGGSDSGKNIRPMLTENGKAVAKHTSMMMAAVEAMRLGYDHGGMTGAALAGGGAAMAYLLNGLRDAGIRSIQDLYREALADPEKARLLISKMPASPEGGKLRHLTGMIRKELIVGPMLTSEKKN